MDSLPPCLSDQVYVRISALAGSFLTLPERLFVNDADPNARKTVPSLAFLIQHPGSKVFGDASRGHACQRFMFDLGLRSDPTKYTPAQQKHLETRRPLEFRPGVVDLLANENLTTADIDVVILSHIHWDHHGDPAAFDRSKFLVGPGSLSLLQHGLPGAGSHSHFDPSLLPASRTEELPPNSGKSRAIGQTSSGGRFEWKRMGPFPAVVDLLRDGSIYVLDAPGHLPGHINLLCRTGPKSWVYLGGDTCHDVRILTGEKEIGTWLDDQGQTLCIHVNKTSAETSINRIRQLLDISREDDEDIEVIMTHDVLWLEANQHRLFPVWL